MARHSGRLRALLGLMAVLAAMLPELRAQGLLVDLRDGSAVEAEAVTGSGGSLQLLVAGGGKRRVSASEVLAIRGAAARAPRLLRAELVGGDVVHGALVGGDDGGDRLELLSPVLGQVSLSVDRLSALVQPGVDVAEQVLPDGVDEVLYVATGRGFDLLVGTLHRFGAQGVLFEPDLADAPRWFGAAQFSTLRIAGGMADERDAPCTLLTRTADRLRVRLLRCTEEGVTVASAAADEHLVRWNDVAALVMRDGVVHLSELEPSEIVESGFDGDVIWPFRRDRCAVGGELLAGGRAFGLGLGVHSRSRLSFVVPAGARGFRTRVAIDDSAGELGIEARAAVRVLRGNKVLFGVDDLRPGALPRDSGLITVEPGETITLEADFGGGRDLGDRVDWLLPMFLVKAPS